MRTANADLPVFRDHLPALDGVRGLAVLLVLWAHCTPLVSLLYRHTGISFHFGYLAVEFFFVLSGFLITRILLWDRAHDVPLRYFLARRALRIFPIYYLTLLVVYLFWRDPLTGWAAVYLSNYSTAFMADHDGPLTHTWSLAVEEHFYIIWPLIIMLLSRKKAQMAVQYGFTGLALLSAVMITLLVEHWDMRFRLIFQGTSCRMISLGAGAMLAFHEERLRKMSMTWTRLLMLMGLGGAILTQVMPGLVPPEWVPATKLISFPIMSTCLMGVVIRLSSSSALPIRALQSTPLTFIGRISYGIYLYHLPIYTAMHITAGKWIGVTPVWKGVLAAGVTILVATVSYFSIEAPLLKLKHRFAKKPAQENAKPKTSSIRAAIGDDEMGVVTG